MLSAIFSKSILHEKELLSDTVKPLLSL